MADGVTDMNRASLRRREDAQTLIDGARYAGAMYVAGYAVECLLKSKLMAMFRCHTLRDLEARLRQLRRIAIDASLYTHSLEPLLQLTGRLDVLVQDRVMRTHFATVNRWVPAWRYAPHDRTLTEATRFIAAVDAIIIWVRNNV